MEVLDGLAVAEPGAFCARANQLVAFTFPASPRLAFGGFPACEALAQEVLKTEFTDLDFGRTRLQLR
jgi:hypothetical protein